MTSPTNIILPSLSDDNIDTTTTTAAASSSSFYNNAPPAFPSPLTTTNNGTASASTTTITNGSIMQTSNPLATSFPPTTATPSPSTSATNSIASSPPPIINAPPTAAVWDELTTQMDKFIQGAAIAAYKKSGANVGVISCKYSINALQKCVKDYIWTNRECSTPPTHYLASLRNNDRIVLADFNISDKRVGYYDTQKKECCKDFFLVKYSVEKYFNSMHFDVADQKSIDSTINDLGFPSFAHLCRIAEEICFNGKNRILKPFNIKDEADRIKKLLSMISAQGWNGEWLPTIKESRVESVIQEVILGGGGGCASTTNPRVTVVNGQNVSPLVNGGAGNVQAGVTPQRRSIDAGMAEVANKRFSITSRSMEVYEKKYPILSQMLKIYLNFTKLRLDRYKRNESFIVQNTFNYNDYILMNHYDAEDGLKLFNDFPYFKELQSSEKAALIHRFRDPFFMFERIYDTLNTVGDRLNDQYIMLQDGSCFSFDLLNQTPMPPNMSHVFKVIFASWKSLLPIVRKISPDIIEAVYIFCCILWNSSYLDIPLSENSEEIIRRGRLIIHKEMKEFYNYDDVLWERIYALRHVMLITEDNVGEYKKRVRNI